jgi:hypothetical protein
MADLVGWLAAALTLLTFSMRSMAALRLAAIGANFCFIAYGLVGGLVPVLVLHLVLLPCNVLRLVELCRPEDRPIRCPDRAAIGARCSGETASREVENSGKLVASRE